MSEENKNLEPQDNEEVESQEVTEEIAEINEEVVEETTIEADEEAVEEEAVEANEEAVEETIEDINEEIAQEATEDAAEGEEIAADEEIETEIIDDVSKKKPITKPLVVGIVCVVVLLAIAAVLFFNAGKWFNKYNRKYIDVTGRTVGEVAEEMGYDYNDFLVQMKLPLDMPKNTYEYAAVYSRTFGTMAELYGMSVDEFKEMLGLGDEVTAETKWGEAYDTATLDKIVGEDNLEEFKKQYGLGDEVTLETKWGEIRGKIDEFERNKMLEEKKALKETEKAKKDDEALVDGEENTDEVEKAMDEAATETADTETEKSAE